MSAFATLWPLLVSRYRVWTFDLPGCGASDPLPAGAGIDHIAAALIRAMDELGAAHTHVYGLHTGNKIGAAMAAGWPFRIGKFIFAGQTHSIIADQDRRNRVIGEIAPPGTEAAVGKAALLAWEKLYASVGGRWREPSVLASVADPDLRRRVIAEMVDELAASETKLALYQANFGYDLGRDLVRIVVPTLVLEVTTPSEDAALGRQGRALQAIIPGCELATLAAPNQLNVTLEDRAEEIAAIIIGFLG
jgi:pimeloyl-ACP methyl ester carboxylesterase